MNNENENKEIILNQIDRINTIEKLNNNKITNDILYMLLEYNIKYYYIEITEEDLIETLIIKYNYKITIENILNSIIILVDKNILIKHNSLDGTNYYGFNNKYFNDNDI